MEWLRRAKRLQRKLSQKNNMKVTILNPKHVVYDGEAKSVFLPGDMAEIEILDYHVPIVSLLRPGKVIVDWKKEIVIKQGMVKFDNNECMILIEE
jgi:F-type H+-transporting ATPase subunit epsilon